MSTVTRKDSKEDIIKSFQQTTFGEAKESRARAIDLLEKKGLPGSKHEEYRFAPVTRQLESHFTWKNEITPSTITSVAGFEIPDLDANVVVVVNGSYSKTLSRIVSPAAEIIIKPLSEAFQAGKENIAAYEAELLAYAVKKLSAIPSVRLIGTATDKVVFSKVTSLIISPPPM